MSLDPRAPIPPTRLVTFDAADWPVTELVEGIGDGPPLAQRVLRQREAFRRAREDWGRANGLTWPQVEQAIAVAKARSRANRARAFAEGGVHPLAAPCAAPERAAARGVYGSGGSDSYAPGEPS